MMLSLTMKFLDENKWKLMPVAFDFKDRDLVRSYNREKLQKTNYLFEMITSKGSVQLCSFNFTSSPL